MPEVVVIGGGIMGSASAYFLAKKGAHVTLIERYQIAGCASGKAGGFLASSWGDSITEDLHQKGFALHKSLAKDLSIESFRELKTLNVATGGRKKADSTCGCDWLDGTVSNVSLMDDSTAQVTPHELTNKLADAAVAHGASIIIGTCEGVNFDSSDSSIVTSVIVDGKEITGDSFVFTLGPWSVLLEKWMGVSVPMQGIKSTSIIIQHPPESVQPFALFCGEDHRGTHLEVYPRPDGSVYICGCGGSNTLAGDAIVNLPPDKVVADPKRVKAAMDSFKEMSNSLGNKDPSVTQACMRPCPADGRPLIGPIPQRKNAFIAAGHNCWGILWGPVTGAAISELVLDGESKIVNLAAFSLNRFNKQSAARGRHKKGEKVGEQW